MAEKTIDEAITETALQPAKVEVDGQIVTSQSIRDQIAAAKFAAQQTSRASTGLPIRIGLIRPRGTV